jgi:hypothetical protein
MSLNNKDWEGPIGQIFQNNTKPENQANSRVFKNEVRNPIIQYRSSLLNLSLGIGRVPLAINIFGL